MIRLNLTAKLRGKSRAVACVRFDSMADWSDHLARDCAAARAMTESADVRDGWRGADTATTLARAAGGDAARVAMADAMLARLEDAVGFEARRWRAVDAVAGGVPNVPAYLAGAPLAMRRRARMMDTAAPLTIAVELGVSASVDAPTIARRGAAALALARIAAATRPVELWAYFAARDGSGGGDALMAVRLDTAPVDVARAAWLFCAPEALRRAGFATLDVAAGGWTDGEVKWLDTFETHKTAAADLFRRAVGAEDVVTVHGLLSNGDVHFGTDAAAAAWVREALEAHGAVERAA